MAASRFVNVSEEINIKNNNKEKILFRETSNQVWSDTFQRLAVEVVLSTTKKYF